MVETPHLEGEVSETCHRPRGFGDFVEAVESGISTIFSRPGTLAPQHARLTSTELQVANLIRSGKRNKEIASVLGVSLNTVLTHRYHLRSKLGLKREKINLVSYLNATK